MILVIVNQLTKIIHYEPVKLIIDISSLAKMIIDIVVYYHGVSKSIITNQGLLFISKFCTLLCYFLGIKKKLSTAFHSQTDGQTKRQNSIIEAYFRVFVNWEYNTSARLLPKAEFTYNNTKNSNTSHTPFEFNYGYHLRLLFEKNINSHLRSFFADKPAEELKKLMEFYCQNLLHT